MRSLTVRRYMLEPESIFSRILDPKNVKEFHGPNTEISAWTGGKQRNLSFYVDASDSPVRLGSYVKAHVEQTYTGTHIRNRVKILNIVSIDSTWTIEKPWLVIRANIHVHLPPPLSWIAEKFVEKRAETQLNDYISCVSCE